MKVPVRFNRAMAPFNAGECAGFDEDRVLVLERQGYVTRQKVQPHAEPPPPPPPPAPPPTPPKKG